MSLARKYLPTQQTADSCGKRCTTLSNSVLIVGEHAGLGTVCMSNIRVATRCTASPRVELQLTAACSCLPCVLFPVHQVEDREFGSLNKPTTAVVKRPADNCGSPRMVMTCAYEQVNGDASLLQGSIRSWVECA